MSHKLYDINTHLAASTVVKSIAFALPSCLQAVFALSIVKPSIQIVPQALGMYISSLPKVAWFPASRKSPCRWAKTKEKYKYFF